MCKYQIIAVVDTFNFEGNNVKVTLNGVGKYCFETEKNGTKERYNLLEQTDKLGEPKPVNSIEPIGFDNEKIDGIAYILLSHAFLENKRLKFVLNVNVNVNVNEIPKETYTIISISKAD
jgi:hypothetical protein